MNRISILDVVAFDVGQEWDVWAGLEGSNLSDNDSRTCLNDYMEAVAGNRTKYDERHVVSHTVMPDCYFGYTYD